MLTFSDVMHESRQKPACAVIAPASGLPAWQRCALDGACWPWCSEHVLTLQGFSRSIRRTSGLKGANGGSRALAFAGPCKRAPRVGLRVLDFVRTSLGDCYQTRFWKHLRALNAQVGGLGDLQLASNVCMQLNHGLRAVTSCAKD